MDPDFIDTLPATPKPVETWFTDPEPSLAQLRELHELAARLEEQERVLRYQRGFNEGSRDGWRRGWRAGMWWGAGGGAAIGAAVMSAIAYAMH